MPNDISPIEPRRVLGNSLAQRALSGFMWIGSGMAAQSVIQVATVVVLARLLSPAEFGVVGAALIVTGFSQLLSEIGLGPAIVQRKELTDRHIHCGFTASIAFSVVLGAFVLVCAPLYGAYIRQPDVVPIVNALAWTFPLKGPGLIGTALLQRHLRFKQQALYNFVSITFGYGIIGIAMAYNGFGAWSLVAGYFGQVVIHTALVLVATRQFIGLGWSQRELNDLLKFGVGFTIAKIANYAANQLDNVIISRYLGATALGIYGRAYQFLMLPVNLLGTVSDKVIFPMLASFQDDKARLARAYVMSLSLISLVALPLSAFLFVLAPDIIYVMLGDQWSAVIVPFRVLVLVLVFRTGYKMSDALSRALGAVYRRAWRQWAFAMAIGAGALVGQRWGVVGVAFGVALAVLLNFLLMLHLSIRLAEFSVLAVSNALGRHALFGLCVLVVAYSVRKTLGADVDSTLAIVVCASAVCLVSYIAVRFFPRIFGTEGVWVVNVLKKRFLGKHP